MRVLVTGGSGRAGTYTVRELARANHEVVNLDTARPPAGLPGQFIQLDLTDAGGVYDAFFQIKPEGVCHLAANPSPQGFPRQQTFQNFEPQYGDVQSVFRYRKMEQSFGWKAQQSWRNQ